jgi:ATP-dependent Lon protease
LKGFMPRQTPAKEGTTLQVPVLPLRGAVHFPELIQTVHVVREGSRQAIRYAQDHGGLLFCVAQQDDSVESPKPSEFHKMGVVCRLVQVMPLPDGTLRIGVHGDTRARARQIRRTAGKMMAIVEPIPLETEPTDSCLPLVRAATAAFGDLVELSKTIPAEAMATVAMIEDPGLLADTLASHLPIPWSVKQRILEELNAAERLQITFDHLAKELETSRVQRDILDKVDASVGQAQREFMLREQLRAIQSELGQASADAETEQWREKLKSSKLPKEVLSRLEPELNRLERFSPDSPEGGMLRSHLEWVARLPWSRRSADVLDFERVSDALDRGHFGLQKVKDRVLDYLAVRQISRSLRGPILCFTGPPGVGKTSIAKQIASAMGREFAQVSLGGVRDEAEIRGHRRTYVGAMPGRIMKELARCRTKNPVMLLDEIDKLGAEYRGDPAGALLEALDPSLNIAFSDHYIDLPFDLSEVLFIATANTTETILPALLDRMEVVDFPTYSQFDRRLILEQYIWPRMIAEHGLAGLHVEVDENAFDILVGKFSDEAGVRKLEQRAALVCRKIARKAATGCKSFHITAEQVRGWIGEQQPPFSISEVPEIGLCRALAVSSAGGTPIDVEVATWRRSGPDAAVQITGNLGEVMRESVLAAMTFVRTKVADDAEQRDVHVHFGEGGLAKEGPSAGLAVAVALASALTGRPVRERSAATGEISLRGVVAPVGGVAEKLLAAHRHGLQRVVIPNANLQDLAELPSIVQNELEIVPVKTISEALQALLEPAIARAAINAP